MTTLEQLAGQDPAVTHGHDVPYTHGVGQWRFVVEVADPQRGDNVVWHDLTGPVAELNWRRGGNAPAGRFQAIQPVLLIQAPDNRYATWNSDNSAYFGGTHVPLQGGLLLRAGLFRVDGGAVTEWFPLFTSRVWKWGDQSASLGQIRYHRVQCVDLATTLNNEYLPPRPPEGWRARLDTVLASWDFGYDVYAAELSDGSTTLQLAERREQPSAVRELDATLDPVGLTWRVAANGRIVIHPFEWDLFHDGWFTGGTTITGTQWSNPLLTEYPTGVTFDWSAVAPEVQYVPEQRGSSFGIESNYENIANQQTVTHPVDANDSTRGVLTSAYDDVASASEVGRRDAPGGNWQAQNDAVVKGLVKYRAFADRVCSPLVTDVDRTGAFPAIALLDHYDPVTINHRDAPTGTDITVTGLVRWVEHRIRPLRDDTNYDGALSWTVTVLPDLDATRSASLLVSPTTLMNTAVTPTTASFTWVDPGGHAVTPTQVQVRVLGAQSQWQPIGWPISSYTWSNLRPSTFYEFEVRYVRRVANIVDYYSEPTRLVFTTAEQPRTELTAGGQVGVIPPESLDPDPTCVTNWKLEQSFDGQTWLLADSGTDADFGTSGADTILDLSSFNFVDGVYYRLGTRLVCGDEANDWHYTLPYRRNGSALETVVVELFRLDESIATGTNITTEFWVPWPGEITGAYLSVTGDQSTSGIISVDVNLNGTSAMSTVISIDANEGDSETAATAHAFSTTALSRGDVLSFDCDAAGTGATGPLMLTLFIERQVGV